MRKINVLLLICLSLLFVSCDNKNVKDENSDRIFNIALNSKHNMQQGNMYAAPILENIGYNQALEQATITSLYIQDSSDKNFLPYMAKEMPVDVSKDYANGPIIQCEYGMAWKIELRNDLCWENGEKITAVDFINTIVLTKSCSIGVVNAHRYYPANIDAGIIDISDLGIKAEGNSLILIYSEPKTVEEICDKLAQTDFNLVNEKIYNNCFVEKDGVLQNIYGSSPENYLSYGPYKLIKLDETGIHLVRNENWFGYSIWKEDYYQTEEIVVDYLEDYSKSYDLLVDGKYDFIDLQYYLEACDEDLFDLVDKKYLKKRYNYNPQSKILYFNSNYDSLLKMQERVNEKKDVKYNYTIFSILEFRKALTYALELNSLIKDLESISMSMYYEKHPSYTPRRAINKYTGEPFYNSKEFEEIKENYFKEINGDVDCKQLVKDLFNEAYTIALNNGYLTENDIISINFGNQLRVGDEGSVFVAKWQEAMKGTLLEGKVKFYYSASEFITFYHGFQYFNIFWSYPDTATDKESLTIEYALTNMENLGFTEFKDEEITIEFAKVIDIFGQEYNNVSLTTSISNWINGFSDKKVNASVVLDGKKITLLYKDNADITNKILAECEKFLLNDFSMIPTLDRYDFDLISDKVNLNYDTESHMFFYDFRYITYN